MGEHHGLDPFSPPQCQAIGEVIVVVAMERPLDNVNVQEEDKHGVKNGVEEAEPGGATAAAHFLAKSWPLRGRRRAQLYDMDAMFVLVGCGLSPKRRDQSYAYIRETGRTFSTLRHTLKYWGVSNTSPPRK